MLRPGATIEGFHTRQVGTLPEHYDRRVTDIAEAGLAAHRLGRPTQV